jgi:RNA polymerase sigma-70 factor (ECF subfamily)
MGTDDSRPFVLRAQAGDAAALDDLLARHLPGLRAYVRLQCGAKLRARESASDIVQSACRDVLQNLAEVPWNGEARFKAWLYAAALRKVLDRVEYWGAQKRDARHEVPLDDVYATVCSPSQEAIGREALERLETAFDRLKDQEREIILLARVIGLSHAEIAERLSCTENHARQKLFRALSALSESMEA